MCKLLQKLETAKKEQKAMSLVSSLPQLSNLCSITWVLVHTLPREH